MFTKFSHKFNILQQSCRKLLSTQLKEKLKEDYKTKSWQINSYGGIEELQLNTTRIPIIEDPQDLLIDVEAASVNPIDMMMIEGYGNTLFKIPRNFEMEFPLVVGRDFCGTIIQKGHCVDDSFKIGDKVYGFIPIHKQGSFSRVIRACKTHVCLKPDNLSPLECTALVYSTMTAWAALYITGNLCFKSAKGLRVLILGASGGVGTAAVQLLKSQGCQVFATCATDAVPLVQSLGADDVFDYKKSDYMDLVAMQGHYHFILDCAKFGYENIPKSISYCSFITLNSPLLKNTDTHGLLGGLCASASYLLQSNLTFPGKTVKWGFFVPSGTGFKFIDNLIRKGDIKPVIHKEFTFNQLPAALEEVSRGHLRGKVVIKYD